MSSGKKFTVPAAQFLSSCLEQNRFHVLFDHGDKNAEPNVGKLVSWFGAEYKEPFRPAQLAQLDIAVLSNDASKALALIEVEDSGDNPKTLLGDVFGALLGSGVTFEKTHKVEVGQWTTLVVLAFFRHPQSQTEFRNRIIFLESALKQIKPYLSTPNALIGKIIIDTFSDQDELNAKLKRHVADALNS